MAILYEGMPQLRVEINGMDLETTPTVLGNLRMTWRIRCLISQWLILYYHLFILDNYFSHLGDRGIYNGIKPFISCRLDSKIIIR